MRVDLTSVLEKHLELMHEGAWTSYRARPEFNLSGYGTRRIAKLTDEGELFFTIGATKRGLATGLNRAIRTALQMEISENDIVEGTTTSGSRGYEAIYPGLRLSAVSGTALRRILLRVEGAVILGQIQALQ